MQSSKQLTIDTLSSYKYPLANTKLLQEIRRVRARNRGPSLYHGNICEVAKTCSEEFIDIIKHYGFSRFEDETEVLCKSGRLTLTRNGYNRIHEYISKVLKYQSELKSLSDEDLRLYAEGIYQARARLRRNAQDADDKFAFFHSKAAEARFDYWLRLPSWTVEEAVALSLGKDPSKVNQEKLIAFDKHHESSFCAEYFKRLQFVQRATDTHVLSENLDPVVFGSWCERNDIPLPPRMQTAEPAADEVSALRAECDRLRKELEDYKRQGINEIGGRPKRITLLKIIIGMAVARFEHRTEKNSGAPGAIEKNLYDIQTAEGNINQSKISVSDDLVRIILTEAARELDFCWENEISWRGIRRL